MKSELDRRMLFAALVALSLTACGGGTEAHWDGVLRFTAIPDSNKTELQAKFEPLAAHLSEVLGFSVEYVPTADYSASVEMFKNGDVQLAWFGGLTGVQARAAVEGARAIAQGAVDPHFKSYFVAHSPVGARPGEQFPVEALRGKRFTFGSRQSTSGRLMPEFFLREATGQGPDEFFAEVGFSGAHDKTALLVDSGAWDVGALNYKTYDRLLAEGKLSAETCRIVWTTPEYADYNWTVHPAVLERYGAGAIAAIAEALTGLEDERYLAAIQRPEGLIPAANEDFAGIEAVAKDLGFLR